MVWWYCHLACTDEFRVRFSVSASLGATVGLTVLKTVPIFSTHLTENYLFTVKMVKIGSTYFCGSNRSSTSPPLALSGVAAPKIAQGAAGSGVLWRQDSHKFFFGDETS